VVFLLLADGMQAGANQSFLGCFVRQIQSAFTQGSALQTVETPFSHVYIATRTHPNRHSSHSLSLKLFTRPVPLGYISCCAASKACIFKALPRFYLLVNDWKIMLSTRQHHADTRKYPTSKYKPPPPNSKRLSNLRERPLHCVDTTSQRHAVTTRSAKGHGGVW
jgi:hypothetical protein